MVAKIECRSMRVDSPEVTIIPTGIVPKICVTASRELPPCGIGKFKKAQHEYEVRIEKIRQSFMDMLIVFKDSKGVSFENDGPGRIYLESFESLSRKMDAEKMEKERKGTDKAARAKSYKIINSKMEDQPSVSLVRVSRSLTTTVLTATECIPLGVEFCEDFPRPPAEETKFSKIQKRSLPSLLENFKLIKNTESKEKSDHNSNSVTDGLIEIIPQNEKDFFKRVDKRSVSEDLKPLDNGHRGPEKTVEKFSNSKIGNGTQDFLTHAEKLEVS